MTLALSSLIAIDHKGRNGSRDIGSVAIPSAAHTCCGGPKVTFAYLMNRKGKALLEPAKPVIYSEGFLLRTQLSSGCWNMLDHAA